MVNLLYAVFLQIKILVVFCRVFVGVKSLSLLPLIWIFVPRNKLKKANYSN